jgi:hypothetical protein
MPSHIHLIYRAQENNPEVILGRFKEHTSKQLIKTIDSNLPLAGARVSRVHLV